MINVNRLLIFGFVTTLIGISGCDLLSNDSGDSDEVTFEADIEGKNFEGVTFVRFFGDTLDVSGIKRIGECDSEGVHMRMAAFEREGTYPIYRNAYTQTIGCDVGSSFGNSDDTTGTATITAFNASSNIIEGEFQFELTANYDFDDVEEGETFTVRGHFRSQMERSN